MEQRFDERLAEVRSDVSLASAACRQQALSEALRTSKLQLDSLHDRLITRLQGIPPSPPLPSVTPPSLRYSPSLPPALHHMHSGTNGKDSDSSAIMTIPCYNSSNSEKYLLAPSKYSHGQVVPGASKSRRI